MDFGLGYNQTFFPTTPANSTMALPLTPVAVAQGQTGTVAQGQVDQGPPVEMYEGMTNVNSSIGFGSIHEFNSSSFTCFEVEQITTNLISRIQNDLNKSNPTVDTSRILYELKEAFSAFMNYRGAKIFEFLQKPIKDQEGLNTAIELMIHFSSKEYSPHADIKQLFINTSLEEEKAWLNTRLGNPDAGETCLSVLSRSISKIAEVWIEILQSLKKAESELIDKAKKIDDIQKKVNTIQLLPVNDVIIPVVESLEKYVTKEYELQNLEPSLNKCISIYKKIFILQETMASLRVFNNQGSAPTCPICIEKSVDTVLIPCGHTFCSGCITHGLRFACGVCRTNIQKKMKVFFT